MTNAPGIPAADLFCPFCNYNLKGIDSERCPECGRAFDHAALAASTIPWEHRREIGLWKAWWRTVRLTTLRPGLIAENTARPLSLPSARAFRRVTLAVVYGWAFLWACVITYLACISPVRNGWERWCSGHENQGFLDTFWGFLLTLLAGFLWLCAATSVNAWFFHIPGLSSAQRGRALILSHYACGPLALLPLCSSSALALAFSLVLHYGPSSSGANGGAWLSVRNLRARLGV